MAKCKLTPELIAKAEKLIASGNYVETACKYLCINKSTWYDWLNKAESRGGIYIAFSNAIKKAEAEAEILAVSQIVLAGNETWQALAWYLERKYPDRWGKRERKDATDDSGIKALADAIRESRKNGI